MTQNAKQFDVALSFGGEDRDYVEKVAHTLTRMGIQVFYDKYERVTLWGRNLYDYFIDIYQNKSRYTVIFCSKHYAEKLWTDLERKSAQAKAFKSSKEYILPTRFDNTEIPGILDTIGFVDLNEYSPEEFAELVKEKTGDDWYWAGCKDCILRHISWPTSGGHCIRDLCFAIWHEDILN